MNDIILTSTLHDPEKRLYSYLGHAVPFVTKYYNKWIISVTATTHPDIKYALTKYGAIVAEPNNSLSSNSIENDHLNALYHAHKIATQFGVRIIQYTDGDRIIMAANHYKPDLLRSLSDIKNIINNSEGQKFYINLRRDAESFLSHHNPLVVTEFEFNRLYTLVFNMPLDVGSTGHVFSINLVTNILERMAALDIVEFPHPKWIIIAKQAASYMHSLETMNILSFETPLQYKLEIESAMKSQGANFLGSSKKYKDNYGLIQKAYITTLGITGQMGNQSKTEWKRRINLARQYVIILKNNLISCISNKQTEVTVRTEVDNTLTRLARLENKITSL